MVAETGYSMVTGESLLQPGVTSSGSNNRSFLNTPSLTTAGRLINVPGVVTQDLLGTGTTTRREFKDAWAAVPGFNTYGLRGFGNWLSESMPRSEPAAQPATTWLP